MSRQTATRPHTLVWTLIGVLLVILAVNAATLLDGLPDRQSSENPAKSAPVISVDADADADADEHGTKDYYTPRETTVTVDMELEPGQVTYCPLDELGRATCAVGLLTPSLREDARERGRQDITVDPAGWPEANSKVLIPALSHVEGSQDYNGWMWNRSHLLADSLGGDAVAENLVPGTRTQNVGSTQTNGQADGGMAHLERLTREYLDAQADDSCPVTYTAVPVYAGDELVPRSVAVSAVSCDHSLDESVQVSNTANGWSIDYTDGSYTKNID